MCSECFTMSAAPSSLIGCPFSWPVHHPSNITYPSRTPLQYYQDMEFPFGILALLIATPAWSQPSAYTPGVSPQSIAWGPANNGLRLGIAFGSAQSGPTLGVAWQNVGSQIRGLVIGHECGSGPIYDWLKFIATGPDGKEHEFLHRGVYIPIAGLVLPMSVRLNAGAIYERQIPLTDILCTSRTEITLDTALRQGYSVRVRFEVTEADYKPDSDWSNVTHPWIGTVSSGAISRRVSVPTKN